MAVSPADVAFVRDLVYRRSAIVLDETKQYLIETRLDPVAHAGGFASIGEFINAARGGSQPAQGKLVEALTTNETLFFRDVAPYEALKRSIVPGLLAARATTRTLNVWSAACSTGQEPYSLAMALLDGFPQLAGWRVRILATDLSESALERARAGRFKQLEVNRGLPAPYLLKYFKRVGTEWEIKPAVRDLVEFTRMNLADAWVLPAPADVVFLRNVLIYFDVSTKRGILDRVGRFIAPHGALVLGAAETTLGIDDRWERVPFENTAYYRKKQ